MKTAWRVALFFVVCALAGVVTGLVAGHYFVDLLADVIVAIAGGLK